MTTIYPSKEAALKLGIYFAGRSGDLKVADLKKVEGEDIVQLDKVPLGAEVYELTNSKGEKVRIATAPCRDGFDLWLISSEGSAIRT